MTIVEKIKDIYKKWTFKEEVKVIRVGELSVEYLGNGEYIGMLFDMYLDTEFPCTEKGTFEEVYDTLVEYDFDYPSS